MLDQVLIPGCSYRIRSKSSIQKYPRESVMTFLGMVGDNYSFSARPVAGTQTMDHHMLKDVLSVEQVPTTFSHYLNKIIREGM